MKRLLGTAEVNVKLLSRNVVNEGVVVSMDQHKDLCAPYTGEGVR